MQPTGPTKGRFFLKLLVGVTCIAFAVAPLLASVAAAYPWLEGRENGVPDAFLLVAGLLVFLTLVIWIANVTTAGAE